MHNQTMPRDGKCHTIAIDSKSHLFDILKTENLAVNSFHHQSIKILADGFDVVAQSSDGVIEAIEGFPKYNILAVQFHPEDMEAEKSNVLFISIFAEWVGVARNYKIRIKKKLFAEIY